MPNFEGFEEEAPKAPDFAAMGFTPDESAFVGPQPPIPTAEQEALQAPAIDPVSTAVGMGTLGVVPTAIGLATEPGFRENVGKPVQNLVAKVAPKAAPYAGDAAEILAGLGLGAGMGKGTSAGRVTMEDAPPESLASMQARVTNSDAASRGAYEQQASDVANAPDYPKENGAQRLLEGPAAAPEAPAQPRPVQPQQSGPRALPAPKETQIEPFDFKRQREEDEFVKGMLNRYPKGDPGLDVTETNNEPDSILPPQYHVVYRGPDGTPVAAAVVEREGTRGVRYLNSGEMVPQDLGVTGIATDKLRGLLSGKAAVEVAKELQKRGWAKPLQGTEMTSDSRNLLARAQERGNKAGLEQQPTKALRVGDKIIQPEPTDVMHAQMFERLAPEDQEKAEPGWMVNGEFKSEPRTVPFKKPDLTETAQNLGPQETPDEKTIRLGKEALARIQSRYVSSEMTPYEAARKGVLERVAARRQTRGQTGSDDIEDAQIVEPQIDTNNSPSSTLEPQSLGDFKEVDEAPPAPEADPYKRADIYDIPTKDIAVAPDAFQYKVEGIDPKTGAGESGRGAEAFDYNTAPVALWHDSKGELGSKGQLYVAHGHHRYSIANRTDAPTMRGTVWDSGNDYPGAEFHGVTKEEARARGAFQNFRDGKGTAVDVATYLRDTPNVKPQDMAKMGIDLKSKMMQQGVAMQHLTAPVWYQASIGKLRPDIASIIGKNLDNPRDQVTAMKSYQQKDDMGRPMSPPNFEFFTQRLKNAQQHTTSEDTLFGKEEITRSTLDEEADIMGAVARKLTEQGNAFGTAAKKKDLLEKGENVINAETSKALSKEATDRLAVLRQYGVKQGTNTDIAIKKFARHLAEKPSQRKAILDEASDAIIKAIDKDNPDMPAEQEDSKTGSLF